ncbi:tetratricopeptide repeat protein [Engelhardtia mirabilis]|uniref:Tetratricopeptide repeat protein n=1 Tax=Engelhardtia mirabilis TaxID=2528011 RepID=A0A518BS65_9BACT|nr:tetratricopeptide repeat protein [Planctomycetes bacterium Pla133]QDV04140.1 tetratricopeptide repeat protein [Planctomycetes bacterium Pla86]
MRYLLPVLLLALVFAAFSASLGGEFVYDDRSAIQANPLIRDLGNLPQFFSGGYWDFLRPEESARIAQWRPLTATTLALGYALGDGSPHGFRLTSILVHLAATLAAFALGRRVGLGALGATLAAAVYGLHPVQVEAVAWSSSIADPLLGLFGLVSIERWIAWRQRGSRGLPLGFLTATALALLSKEVGLVLLLVPFLVDRVLRPTAAAQGSAPQANRRGPLVAVAALAALYLGARIAVFGQLTGGLGRVNGITELPLARRISLRFDVIGDALATLVAPFDLRVFHTVDPLGGGLSDGRVIAGLAAVGAIAVGLWVLARRRSRLALFGGLLTLLPLLPIVARPGALGRFPLSDRYLVLSTAGLGLLLAALVQGLASRPARRNLAQGALVVYALLLGLVSFRRVPVWHDDETLFTTAAEESPESPLPHWSLGRVLLERFQQEPALDLAESALSRFERALDIAEDFRQDRAHAMVSSNDVLQSNIGLGWSYLLVAPFDGYGDYESPQRIFELQLDARPDSREAWVGLGATLKAQKRFEEAIDAFGHAIQIDRRFAEAHFDLGQVYMEIERFGLARASFERVLELRSGVLDDYLWAARAAIEERQLSLAEGYLATADRLAPGDPQAPTLQSTIAFRRRDYPAALDAADEALRRDGEHAWAHSERAKALLQLGQDDDALLAFRRACDFGPEQFEPHYNVAAILIGRGATEAALPYLRRAYELCPDSGLRGNLRGDLSRAFAQDRAGLIELARLDGARGDIDSGLYWAQGALNLDPDDVDALRLAAELLRRDGRPADAAQLLFRAVEVRPGAFPIVRELGLALVEAGDGNAARPWLQEALELLDEALPGDSEAAVKSRELMRGQLEHSLEAIPLGPTPAPSNDGE